MSDSSPVRWGVLSTAKIGTEKVLPAMQRSNLCDMIAIGSRDGARAEEAASALGVPRAYGSYEELIADADIEAVYVPLPNHMHGEWTIAAAEAGKHVLCEKPLAMTARQAREMAVACADAGVLLMEAFMYRLHPMWIETKRLVDAGAIGDVLGLDVVFSYFNDDPDNIRNILDAGGGALYDIGCYAVNASRLIFGTEPDRVRSSIRRDPESGVDIVTSAILDFGKATAGFMCSTRMEPNQRVEICGTNGRLVVEIPFNIPSDRPTRILEVSGGNPPVEPGVVTHEIATADPYTIQGEVFSRAVRGDDTLPFAPEDAVANLEVMETIFAEAKTK